MVFLFFFFISPFSVSAEDTTVYDLHFSNASDKDLKLRVWQFSRDDYKEYQKNPNDTHIHYVQSHIVGAKGKYSHLFLDASGHYRLVWKSFHLNGERLGALVAEGEIEFSSVDENKIIEISKNKE